MYYEFQCSTGIQQVINYLLNQYQKSDKAYEDKYL